MCPATSKHDNAAVQSMAMHAAASQKLPADAAALLAAARCGCSPLMRWLWWVCSPLRMRQCLACSRSPWWGTPACRLQQQQQQPGA